MHSATTSAHERGNKYVVDQFLLADLFPGSEVPGACMARRAFPVSLEEVSFSPPASVLWWHYTWMLSKDLR